MTGYPKGDTAYEEHTISTVERQGDTWSITNDDGWTLSFDAGAGVTPEEGMITRYYGKGVGYPVRGLFIDGLEVYYRSEAEDQKKRDDDTYGADAAAMVEKWDAGDTVWSIEMGGMGPGYEQALQVCAMEMLRYMVANPPDIDAMKSDGDKRDAGLPNESLYWPVYRDAMDAVLFADGAPCKRLGLSGAQHGAASNIATMVVMNGPKAAIEMADNDRHIMVSRDFPNPYI